MTAVIFDLDGTLVDSVAAICDVANALLDELGLPPLAVSDARQYVGNGAEVFLKRVLTARDALDSEKFPSHLQRFLQLYAEAPGEANSPFPGADEALRELAREGWAIGLCTNKPQVPAEAVLRAHGWMNLFQTVIAGDTLPQRKPDPAPLLEAARRLGRRKTIFVGDSDVDAETAAAAGMPFVLYTEGYRKSPIQDLPHGGAFSDFSQLLEILRVAA